MNSTLSHSHTIRVYYQDTDAGGIVYHGRYLDFAERARTEMLRDYGVQPVKIRNDYGLIFALRRCIMRFDSPAKLDDLLVVETALKRLGGARMVLQQNITRELKILAAVEVELVFLDETYRPARIPTPFRQKVERLCIGT